MLGGTETKIQEKFRPLFQRSLPMAMFISPDAIQSMLFYLFSSPELYLYMCYRRIIAITSNKAANVSFVLAAVAKFCE